MNKKTAFQKQAEKETKEKLLGLAAKIMAAKGRAQGTATRVFTTLAPSQDVLLGYLQQEAEVADLQRKVVVAIREHRVKCPYCSFESSLSDYWLFYAGADDANAAVQCSRSYSAIRSNESDCRLLLDSKEGKSIQEILSFAPVSLVEIFKLPR